MIARCLVLADPALLATLPRGIFDIPDAQFTDSFETLSLGWEAITTPNPGFDSPTSQFTDSFETTAGWA